MSRFFDRLDDAASTLVPLFYLAGLALGTAAYFSGLVADAGIAVGIGLALGSELHSFLAQRRARLAWGELAHALRAGGAGGELDAVRAQLRLCLGTLAVLVAFQIYTASAFAAATWHPAAGFLPAGVQIGIRGCVVPLLFLLSGFLVPVRETPGAVLARASDAILHYAVGRNVRHWRRRIRRAHRGGGDLSPLMVALLEEAGDNPAARRVTLIAEHLAATERGGLAPRSPLAELIAPAGPVVPASPPARLALTVDAAPEREPEPEPEPPAPGGPGGGPRRPRREPMIRLTDPAILDRPARRRDEGRAQDDTHALRARRIELARRILARDPNVGAERLGELIGAPKSVAGGIKREILAEQRGRQQGPASTGQGERTSEGGAA